MKFRELEKIIKADGWEHIKTVGSYHQYKHPAKPGKVTIPYSNKDLKLNTINRKD
ncbi:MAG: type II toxin-antitoxin system HicA family toxin [Bacillota bacterium]|jgi:predicted RNA binding protein YcfA (HicA-like mRNA interferase family)